SEGTQHLVLGHDVPLTLFRHFPTTNLKIWSHLRRQAEEAKGRLEDGGAAELCQRSSEAVRLPIQYFRDFRDLHCSQLNPNRALRLDRTELEQFLGTVVYMSIFLFPRSRMYWSGASRVQQVAQVMSRDRWEEIKQFIHFCDNMAPNTDDRLVIDALLPKFQALPQDQMLCVGEQMVPFRDRSAPRRHAPQKPHKWAYKLFVLCDTKGLVHSFDIFTGEVDPAPGQPDIGASGNVVLKLAQVVRADVNHLLYFDSRFASLDLLVALANRGIPALGTVQPQGLRGCSFSADAEMKKKGGGAFEEQQAVVDNVGIRAVKWFHNRGVVVASTFASAQPVSTIERHTPITASTSGPKSTTSGCSSSSSSLANRWLLYRRDCDSLGVPSKKQKDLLAFRASIAQALCMEGKDLRSKRRGRLSRDVDQQFDLKKRRGPAKAVPPPEVRSDAVGHWPLVEGGRQRCKLPNCKGQTVYRCATSICA
ncbi:unnamed protein product, partial [Tetraodon nigroviridis]